MDMLAACAAMDMLAAYAAWDILVPMNETIRLSVAAYAERAKQFEQAGENQAALRLYLIATQLQMLLVNPGDAAACFQLGLTFGQTGEDLQAQSAFRAALLLQPAHAEAWNNFGVLADCSAALRHAVRLAPHRADYHTNLAHLLLADGELAEGFGEWEWRTPSPQRDFTQPRWDGSPYPGKTLLIHAEQGFGDCIQFCRYLPAAARRGGRMIVEMRPPLAGLIGRLEGVAEVIPWGATLPPFDLHLPLPSLARLFHGETIPSPYLSADPVRVAAWQAKISAPGQRRVGLVWAGNPQGADRRRSIPFPAIAGLVQSVPEIAFFGLQRDAAQECAGLVQLGHEIGDFDDLAAALASLDLLISVDTAAAHLAGALGYATWVLLHRGHDWRWRGPWYPRARLFRQETQGDWGSLLERVAGDLRRP
jgi:hypothetical protein